MRDLIREYLSYCSVEKGLSTNSIESYRSDLENLSEWAGRNGRDILRLGRNDFREWLIDLGGRNVAENSKRRMLSSIRGFYRFLMIEGHIDSNPAEDIISPQTGLYLPRYLTQTEVEMLLVAPDTSTEMGLRDRAIMELMYASGLRVSEAVSLRTRDIDRDAGILTTTGKGGKTRRVPVGSSALEWIKSYLDIRRKKENLEVANLFVTPAGRPIDRQLVHYFVRKYAEQCGLEGVSPHTLRHSFATHLIQNDADIRSVQQMLGHADISTTQIYTHITSTQLRQNYDRFHPRSRSG